MKTEYESSSDGVVSASGDWSCVDGVSVSQGEYLFTVIDEHSIKGVPFTISLIDIYYNNPPEGVSSKKIFYRELN